MAANQMRALKKLMLEYLSTAESMINKDSGTRINSECPSFLFVRELRDLFNPRVPVLPTTLELRNMAKRADQLSKEAKGQSKRLDAELLRGLGTACEVIGRAATAERAAELLSTQHASMTARCNALLEGDSSWYAVFRTRRQARIEQMADEICA